MKIRKKEQRENQKIWENTGPLRCSKGHPRHGVALHRSEGCLAAMRLEGQKGHPLGLLQRSSATPRRRHCSQRVNFGFFFLKSCIRTSIV